MHTSILPGIFFCLAATASAQNAERASLADAARDWRTRYGATWSVAPDASGAHAELVFGGRAAWNGTPVTDEQWIARALVAIEATRALHGVEASTLVADRVNLLPLGLIGSTDKWSVDFHQELGGLRVAGGDLVVLCDASGALLSLQNHALADTGEIALTATFPAATALEQALLAFQKQFGVRPTRVSEPALAILPVDGPDARVGHLAWSIDVQFEEPGSDPIGRLYWIDARGGYPLRDEASVHFFDVGGTISTMATPGTRADTATNAETAQPAKYMAVTHSGGTVYTDADGNFNIPGVNTAQNVTLRYLGLYGNVDDSPTGIPYSIPVTLNPGPGNVVLLNPASLDTVTSQANIFNHVGTVRDYVRRITPTDATADRVFVGHANIANTCNANYNGSSINFFAAGGSCNNTAFSTVVAHEQGHWLNQLYNTGNGSDGMGEGNADVFALYAYDTPLNGEGFYTSGGAVRTGTNTRQFCGDCSPSCYGEVHRDGEPWMGAAWKVRVNLNNSLGNVAGDLAADTLFMGWMNGYNQTQIRSIIELQWLTLDDDDADLSNGTPHAADIRNGFRAQGFPGYFVDITGTTIWTDQACERGSYPVSATVRALQDSPLASVVLRYRIDGGAWIDAPMAPAGGDVWTGAIPYFVSPANVEYLVRATDTGAHVRDSACVPRTFFVGQVNSFVFENFDAPDAWTHGTLPGAANANDDWQRGQPQGRSGTSQGVPWSDPNSPALGAAAWGNDLGFTGANGAYQASVHNYLRSPAFDCTGQTGVQLIFKRWLMVEKSQFDVARILVNDVEVWRNPAGEHLLDTSWTTQSIDIAALADGNPAVVIQFELESDGGLELGGWQVDELRLGALVRAAQCSPVQSFCPGDGSLATDCPCGNFGAADRGCAHSSNAGGALLTGAGLPAADTVVLAASGMPVTSLGLYMQHDAEGEQVFHDGVLCAGGNLVRVRNRAAVAGTSTFPNGSDTQTLSQRGGVAPGSGARRYYAVFYRNAASTFCPPATANVTNGVMVTW
jgi:hypothetical protein